MTATGRSALPLTPVVPGDRESTEGRRATISACLIVLNEEEALPETLANVEFCDEVIVIDSGSSDATREIAREASAVVIENPWLGFAAQRNLAPGRAGSDWILELDAGERVTPELRQADEDLSVARACPQGRRESISLRGLKLTPPSEKLFASR